MFVNKSAQDPTELHHSAKVPGLGNLVQTAGVTGISSLLAQGLGYVMVLLLTLSLGADGFGLFSLVTTVKGIVVLVGSLSLGVTTVRFAAWYRGKENIVELQKLLSTATWGTLIWSSVVSLTLWLFAPIVAEKVFNRSEMVSALRLISWTIPFDGLFNIWVSGLHGLGFTTKRAYLEQILLPIARLAAVAASFVIGHNVKTVLLLMNIASCISMLAAGWMLAHNVQFWKISFIPSSDWRDWVKYTIPTFLDALLVTSLGGSVEVLLLGVFSTDAVVGIYSAVLRLRFIFKTPMTAFNNALAPLISESYAKKDIQYLEFLFYSTTRWVIIITGPLAIIFTLFGRTVLSVFGTEFTPGYGALLVITLGELISIFAGPVGHLLLMTGYSKIRLFNSIVVTVEQLVLGMALIPRWGITGAAWVAAVSVITISILGLLEIFALLHIQPYRSDLLKLLGIWALSALVTAILHSLLRPSVLWQQAVLAMFFGVGYSVLLFKFGLNEEDHHIIIRFIKRWTPF